MNEIPQFFRQFLLILDVRLALGGNLVDGFEWSLIQVRRFPFQHLYDHDAQGPDIHLVAILLSVNKML